MLLAFYFALFGNVDAACGITKVPLEKGDQLVCSSDVSPFSIFLGRATYREARDKCKSLGRKLAILDSPKDLLQIAYLMYECSFLAGESINTVWISNDQTKSLQDYQSICKAVDARGGVMAGSPSLCSLNMTMYAVCKLESDNFSSEGSESEGEFDSTEASEFNEPKAIAEFLAAAQQEHHNYHQHIYDDNMPSSSNSYDSSTFSRAEPDFEDLINEDSSFENKQNQRQTKTIPDLLNVEEKEEWTTPTPTCQPSSTDGSCTTCTPIPDLIVAPFSILGFKLIQTKLPYSQANCACNQLGMHIALPNFITQWLAALVIYQGAFMSRSIAWIDSTLPRTTKWVLGDASFTTRMEWTTY